MRLKLKDSSNLSVKKVALRKLYAYSHFKSRISKLKIKAVDFCMKWLKHRVMIGLRIFRQLNTEKLESIR
jgi:hypothetical protein